MRTQFTTLKILTCAAFILALSALAQAQATRTWVSGVGDDVNPCSRTAPCKTFAGAISKTAKDGEINVIDPGGFGAVTIVKSITIDGNGAHASILSAGTTGVIVNITDAADVRKSVRLRNISINGAATGTFGIRYLGGLKLFVENVQLYGFFGDVAGRGIRVATAGTTSHLYVKNTQIASTVGGIDLVPSSGSVVAVLDGVNLQGMTDGFILQTNSSGTIRDSFVVLNTGVGVKLSGNAAAAIERTVINHNGTGLQPGAGTTTDLSNSSIIGNSVGIATTGGTVQSHGNNQINLNSTPGAIPSGGAIIGQQ